MGKEQVNRSDAEVQSAVEGAVDAADLSGGSGSAGQFLQTDGTATAWATIPPTVSPSEKDDLSDVTRYTFETNSANTTVTWLNISGSGTLLSGRYHGHYVFDLSVVVDGVSTSLTPMTPQDENQNEIETAMLPPIKFDNSLKITVDTGNWAYSVSGDAWVKQ